VYSVSSKQAQQLIQTPVVIMSNVLNTLVENAIAFGGVAIGSMKANEHASVVAIM